MKALLQSRSAVVLLLCAAIPSHLARAQKTAKQAGRIDDFNGQPEAYEIKRSGQQAAAEQPSLFTSLYVGDTVTINADKAAKDAYIVLNLGENHKVTLCHEQTRGVPCDAIGAYQIAEKDIGKPPGVPSALWMEIAQLFSNLFKKPAPLVPAATVVRGGEDAIVAPLLDAGRMQLAAGTRTLTLVWHGAAPPYRLQLYRQGAAPVLKLDQVPEARLRRDGVVLVPDIYTLRISDASQEALFEKSFRVVTENNVPAIPDELKGQELSPQLARTMQAAWLSQQAGGLWIWEAYLRLADVPEDYAPAQALRRALEAGEPPPSPRD